MASSLSESGNSTVPTSAGHLRSKTITVRKSAFVAANLQRQYTHSSLMSHLLTALSATFPQGEQFFVETVRHVRHRVTDPELQADISGFIGQEAHHAQAHQQFNAHIQTENYNLDKFNAAFASEMQRLRTLSKRRQLAATVALEHFTAMIAGYLLKNPQLLQQLSPNMANLWIWHAVEEIEHKHVAFEVYQQVFNYLPQRRRSMRTISLGFISSTALMTADLLWQDRQHSLYKPRQLWANLKDLGILGHMFVSLLPDYLAFYRQDFHPAQIDQQALMAQGKYWLQTRQIAD